jgi:hypothetical protein
MKLQNKLLNNDILLNNLTSQSIVLFVQNQLGKELVLNPRQVAILNLGCEYLLSSIREFNVKNMYASTMKESSLEAKETSSDIHQEMYRFEGNIVRLFEEYYEAQDSIWQKAYSRMIVELTGKNSILDSKTNLE